MFQRLRLGHRSPDDSLFFTLIVIWPNRGFYAEVSAQPICHLSFTKPAPSHLSFPYRRMRSYDKSQN